MVLRITLHLTFVLPFRVPFRVPAFRLSQLPKVTCYLQFNTCNWTGDQQCTVSGSRCYEHPNPATVSGDLNKLGCPWCYQDKLSEHSSKWSTQSIFNRKLHVSPVFSHMILGLFLPAVPQYREPSSWPSSGEHQAQWEAYHRASELSGPARYCQACANWNCVWDELQQWAVEEAALQENNQQLDYGTVGLIVFKTSTHIMLAIFLLLV